MWRSVQKPFYPFWWTGLDYDWIWSFLAPCVGRSPQIPGTICVRWDTATESEWRLNNMARSRVLISLFFFFPKDHEVKTNPFRSRGNKKRAGLGGEAFWEENSASLSPFACPLNRTHQYLPVLQGKPGYQRLSYQRCLSWQMAVCFKFKQRGINSRKEKRVIRKILNCPLQILGELLLQ